MRPKKYLLILICIFGICIPSASAQLRIFAGSHGNISFPSFYKGSELYGIGGGGTVEGGVYFNNFSAGLTAGFSHSSDSGTYVKQMTDFTIGANAGYSLKNDLFSSLPDWLCIRPNISLLADIYNSKGFRSKSKKTSGIKNTSSGCAFAFDTGINFDLINKINYKSTSIVPTIAYNETFCFEEEGIIFSGKLSLGVRLLFAPLNMEK